LAKRRAAEEGAVSTFDYSITAAVELPDNPYARRVVTLTGRVDAEPGDEVSFGVEALGKALADGATQAREMVKRIETKERT
jgi:hypothetical protein